MLNFSEWTPAAPSKGPPLPGNWGIVWPSTDNLLPVVPREGPPLPSGLGIVWPIAIVKPTAFRGKQWMSKK